MSKRKYSPSNLEDSPTEPPIKKQKYEGKSHNDDDDTTGVKVLIERNYKIENIKTQSDHETDKETIDFFEWRLESYYDCDANEQKLLYESLHDKSLIFWLTNMKSLSDIPNQIIQLIAEFANGIILNCFHCNKEGNLNCEWNVYLDYVRGNMDSIIGLRGDELRYEDDGPVCNKCYTSLWAVFDFQ